jgi:hypothetical protein
LTGDDPDNLEQPAERAAIADLGIELHRCRLVGDGTGNIDSYADAVVAIAAARKEGKPVLVHCYAGAQRTGGVVAAYRLLVEGAAPSAVYAELSEYGWSPGDTALVEFLNTHMRTIANRLVDAGLLETVPEPLPLLRP